MLVAAFQLRRCGARGCNRALRQILFRTLHSRMLVRLEGFERISGLSVGSLWQCTRCGRWFVCLRYSRMPLPVTAALFTPETESEWAS